MAKSYRLLVAEDNQPIDQILAELRHKMGNDSFQIIPLHPETAAGICDGKQQQDLPAPAPECLFKLGANFPALFRDFYLALFDSFPAMIWRSNAAHQNDYFNKHWLAFTGKTLAEELALPWPERLHPDDLPACRRVWMENRLEHRPLELHYRIRRHDGEYRWIQDQRGPMYDPQGNFIGYIGICQDVTERKETEEARRASELKYRSLFNVATDGIILFEVMEVENRFLKIVEVNDITCQRLGYTREEMLRLRLPDFNKPQDPAFYADTLQQIMARRNHTFENVRITKNGREIPVEVNAHCFEMNGKEYILQSDRDITERKRAEQALKESEEKFRLLFHNNSDSIFVVIPEEGGAGPIIEVNETACRVWGYRRDELLQMNPAELDSGTDPEKLARVLEELHQTGHVTFESSGITKDKTRLDVEITAHRFEMNGKQVVLTVIRDISERKKAEEKLQQSMIRLRTTLKSAINSLASAIEMRDPYTAGHQERVSRFALAIAAEMGLSEEQRAGIQIAGAIHDIGKLAIPAEILSKPTKLSAIEYSLIKTHSHVGATILSKIEFPWPIAEIVHQHHEKIDGSGYPRGLTGEQILLEARILCVADVIEAISSYRPYRPALGMDKALEEITRHKGSLYDPVVVEVCQKLIAEGKLS